MGFAVLLALSLTAAAVADMNVPGFGARIDCDDQIQGTKTCVCTFACIATTPYCPEIWNGSKKRTGAMYKPTGQELNGLPLYAGGQCKNRFGDCDRGRSAETYTSKCTQVSTDFPDTCPGAAHRLTPDRKCVIVHCTDGHAVNVPFTKDVELTCSIQDDSSGKGS